MKYAIPFLILSLIAVTAYALSIEQDPNILIEKENREKILKCLDDVYSETGSTDMIRKIKFCESLPLLKITGNKGATKAPGSGNHNSEPYITIYFKDGCPVKTDGNVHDGMEWSFTESDFKDGGYEGCKNPFNSGTHSTGNTVPPSLEDTRMVICKKVPTSPLCNKENFEMAQAISYRKALIWGVDDKEKFFRVGIGIMFAESTLGTKFAGTCDSSYNNFGGIKYRILDTGEAIRDQKIPQNGCWVYKFATLEDYFGSKYNSLGKGYGSCFKKKDAVNCIAYAYVGNPNVAEQSWQNNVNTFLN